MHFLRLASICLGAWLGGTLLVMYLNGQNHASVDDLMQEPSTELNKVLMKVERQYAPALMNHHATEMNLRTARTWEWAQLGLGAAVLVAMFFGSDGKRYPAVLCFMMLGSVCFLHWFMTPQMAKLAPSVDFATLDPSAIAQSAVARERFRTFQNGYTITESIKLLLGLLLAGGLVKRRRRRGAVEMD